MSPMNVLFINGIADDRKVKISKIDKIGNVNWMSKGSANVRAYLENEQFNRLKIDLDTRMDQELPRYQMIHGVFNEISDPDTHKITLHKADQFYQAISSDIPFFNIPSRVMRTSRDQIYKLLQGIEKLHVPKTIKIQPKSSQEIHDVIKEEGFQYPVIFRQAGDHGGISTIRVDNETEQFYSFHLDGREYYLTQFVEYKEDGLYRKYRLMVVDGKVYLRHIKISAEWMVHHHNQIEHPEALQKKFKKEFASKIKPAIQPIISQIYNRLELDYFGIDCFIDNDMNILVFEVNASMGIFRQPEGDIFSDQVEKIRKAMIEMINSRVIKNNIERQ
ncbi:hypothetical protein PGH07_04375 [Sulfurovum sp. zt1-1]|uniref:ATP-grasp domain-containing protein n=1 Tax=Sulfurovum zhangzhouensis TaxID=3019067 RepID=A0ABT7QXY1_9BACT|nr:hypothetical protein [Sulfurovum zhangzhouensis]MDM5271404.1 hypothetical protein [Sulfurovum zhangzhouensis]